MTEGGRSATKVTLADVAAHAGVSKTTASFVLSDRPDHRIPVDTADRVKRASRMLGYIQPARRSPAGSTLPVLAVVGDTVTTDPFTVELVRGAIGAAADAGHGLIATDTQGDPVREASIVADLRRRGVTRFVYATTATRRIVLPACLATEDHVVLLNCLDEASEKHCVIPDELAAGALAGQVLLDARRPGPIWLVGEVTPGEYAGEHRLQGLVETLSTGARRLDRRVDCRWWPPEARQAMTAALADCGPGEHPAAVVALNDRIAFGVYQALGARGLQIPDDVSVISFDDSDLAWWVSPELTSIDLPYLAMGRHAIEILLRHDRPPAAVERLPMRLRARQSVRTTAS